MRHLSIARSCLQYDEREPRRYVPVLPNQLLTSKIHPSISLNHKPKEDYPDQYDRGLIRDRTIPADYSEGKSNVPTARGGLVWRLKVSDARRSKMDNKENVKYLCINVRVVKNGETSKEGEDAPERKFRLQSERVD
ncbi:hypothetical protein G5I_13872 [Acromyrmex echinatior]|uniref:Uncharacterized protein n=1 Tax=Acromyrmex echinatior TaxID=103372 RepID=F4X667_ACREC|nr:hypothetical protein G5I_13872 [Acromyrmex echinatior]